MTIGSRDDQDPRLLTYHRQVAESWDGSGGWIVAGSAMVLGGTTLTGLVLGSYGVEWASVYPPPLRTRARSTL